MPVAIVALLDDVSEAALSLVREDLARLAGEPGGAPVRPHLSLALTGDPDTEALGELLREWCRGQPALPLAIAAAGAFPTSEGVVFVAPLVTRELLALHASLHGVLAEAGVVAAPHYRPGHWMPHITVGYGLTAANLPAAVQMALGASVYGEATLTQLALGVYPPLQVLRTYRFGSGPAAAPKA